MKQANMWITLGMSLSIAFCVGMIAPVNAGQKMNFEDITSLDGLAGVRPAPTISIPQPKPQTVSNPPGKPADPKNVATIYVPLHPPIEPFNTAQDPMVPIVVKNSAAGLGIHLTDDDFDNVPLIP